LKTRPRKPEQRRGIDERIPRIGIIVDNHRTRCQRAGVKQHVDLVEIETAALLEIPDRLNRQLNGRFIAGYAYRSKA
jgi:hypothetical protein